MSLYHSIIPAFWQETLRDALVRERRARRAGVGANRCMQLNAQQIASMPLSSTARPSRTPSPPGSRSPDPNWYPNGIGDALHAIVTQIYGWGFSCLYITDRYADGFPRRWTVLALGGRADQDGRRTARQYKYGEEILEPGAGRADRPQPRRRGVHGTSALTAYAQQAWGLLAAGNQSMAVNQGGIPQAVLKSAAQAHQGAGRDDLQAQWMAAAANRGGRRRSCRPSSTSRRSPSTRPTWRCSRRRSSTPRCSRPPSACPAVMLNMGVEGGLTYQNPAALGEMWWRFELRPTATRIANAFSAQMLPARPVGDLRRGRHVRADRPGLRGGRPAALAGREGIARRSSSPLTAIGGTRHDGTRATSRTPSGREAVSVGRSPPS